MARKFVAVIMLFALTTMSAIADDKKADGITSDNLVGKWREGKDGDVVSTVMEFGKDGTVKRTVKIPEEKTREFKGTWKLDGVNLTTTYKRSGGKDAVEVAEITKLTDKALELKTKDGGTVKLAKVVEKK